MDIAHNLMTHASTHYSSAFSDALEREEIQGRSPAIFADSAHETTGRRYKFVSTERVIAALGDAGFLPVDARQTRSRTRSPVHACHVVRLRRLRESVVVGDCVPEIVFLNSHDGSSAYQLRVGIFRAVCANGLIVSTGSSPVWRVSHRADHVTEIVAAALEFSEKFAGVGAQVEQMRRTELTDWDRLEYARAALILRFPEAPYGGLEASHLLQPRRPEDVGTDLWRTLNVVQENIIRGGILGRTPTGRVRRSRGIAAIRADVRLNSGLWELARQRLA